MNHRLLFLLNGMYKLNLYTTYRYFNTVVCILNIPIMIYYLHEGYIMNDLPVAPVRFLRKDPVVSYALPPATPSRAPNGVFVSAPLNASPVLAVAIETEHGEGPGKRSDDDAAVSLLPTAE